MEEEVPREVYKGWVRDEKARKRSWLGFAAGHVDKIQFIFFAEIPPMKRKLKPVMEM